MFIVHWRTAMLAATEMPKLKMCFFTVVGINNFFRNSRKRTYLSSKFCGSTKKGHTDNQNFMDPQKKDILAIKILWIHKKGHTGNQNFVDPQKKSILTIKILWIHKKLHILAITILWIHKKPSICKSQFCGSTKFGQSNSRNFIDPQNHC